MLWPSWEFFRAWSTFYPSYSFHIYFELLCRDEAKQSITPLLIIWAAPSCPPSPTCDGTHTVSPITNPMICQPCAAKWALICCIWRLTTVTKCQNIWYWLFPQGSCCWWTGKGSNVVLWGEQPRPPLYPHQPTAFGYTAWLMSQCSHRVGIASVPHLIFSAS